MYGGSWCSVGVLFLWSGCKNMSVALCSHQDWLEQPSDSRCITPDQPNAQLGACQAGAAPQPARAGNMSQNERAKKQV